jgi:RNA polymerase sigma-70 factor (ECF subfamily)
MMSAEGQDNTNQPQAALEQRQTMAIIEAALQKLPARQREAFMMRYWEDMDVAETAAAMGCSQGSVKTHCSRAVHTLAKLLSEHQIISVLLTKKGGDDEA